MTQTVILRVEETGKKVVDGPRPGDVLRVVRRKVVHLSDGLYLVDYEMTFETPGPDDDEVHP